jgi:hypothetical protein
MNLLIRCSSLGKIMPEPKTKGDVLSVGAKTYLMDLAKQGVYGYYEQVTSKYLEKGIVVENDSIALYNRVNFTALTKNTERREDEYITGECDLIIPGVRGIDVKSSWSLGTFPVVTEDCHDKEYEWQCRGYMRLWNVPAWEVAYCMVDTPEELIRYEQPELHCVSHIPENLRVTSIHYTRDMELEDKIVTKCKAAKEFYTEAVRRILSTHGAV